ncbi:hypothetical protein JCM8097_008552 [Rhodosporidiobolus ruineniae]
MDIDQSDHGSPSSSHDEPQEPWQKTRAGKRIAELKEVEDNIAALFHFAGCTLASLHPDPMSSFTARELATEDDDDDEDEGGAAGGGKGKKAEKKPEGEDKLADFTRYAEGYYATLNDIQLALRTSIRHLRLSRISPAPLLDPSFASLATSGPSAGPVGVGGIALGDLLKPLQAGEARWDGGTARGGKEAGEKAKGEEKPKVSVAALEMERDAWAEVVKVLEAQKGESA